MHTNSYDEALGLPTEESATIALRTQQIIAEESGAADIVDPLGGSHYVEHLTDEIYRSAMSLIVEISEKGGAMSAIKQGWQQQQIHNSAYSHLKDVESGERRIVGVNFGTMDESSTIKPMKVDDNLGRIQCEKLTALRASRNQYEADAALEKIRDAAKSNINLFPLVIDAIKKDCTLGEIMSAMKDVFGTWMAPSGF